MSFTTNTMTLQRNGRIIARDVGIQLDTVNIDIILNSGGLIPTDSYDAYCDAPDYASSVPQRGDYLIDQDSKIAYSVMGNTALYPGHWEVRVTKYLGTTP
jgi:hypothetical protein